MFEPGKQKTGGRKAGTPNKIKQELLERISEGFPDYDPIEAMCLIATDMNNDVSIRLAANKEIAAFIYPKLKSIDMNNHLVLHDTTPLSEQQKAIVERAFARYGIQKNESDNYPGITK